MDTRVYSLPQWRALPRTRCRVAELFGDAVGPCHGVIDRHHVDPDDPFSRTVEVCHRHHPQLEAALRLLTRERRRRRCYHSHRYPGAREACERRMNAA